MNELVLHIGLTKCGSTSIQNFLSDAPDYVGRASANKIADRFSSDFVRHSHLSPFNFANTIDVDSLKRWRSAVERFFAAQSEQSHRVIISREELSKPVKDYLPLFKFVRVLKESVWSDGRVKVIVVLRRQADKIASEYAQRSAFIFNASQNDFERYAVSRSHSLTLDYARLVGSLQEILGIDNVLTLFIEESKNTNFWTEINSFCGLSKEDRISEFMNERVHNQKSIGERQWRIQNPYDEIWSKQFANTTLVWTWPHRVLPPIRRFVWHCLKWTWRGVWRARGVFERRREEKIILTQEIENQICESFRESNTRLGALLGRDISEIGYC